MRAQVVETPQSFSLQYLDVLHRPEEPQRKCPQLISTALSTQDVYSCSKMIHKLVFLLSLSSCLVTLWWDSQQMCGCFGSFVIEAERCLLQKSISKTLLFVRYISVWDCQDSCTVCTALGTSVMALQPCCMSCGRWWWSPGPCS